LSRSRDTSDIFDPSSPIVIHSELVAGIISASAAAVFYTDSELGSIDLSSTIQTASAAAVSYLVDGAPGALNTLNELAAALNDDQNFATSILTTISSASASTLSAANLYTDNATPDLTPAIQAASAAAVAYTDQEVATAIVTASAAAASYTDSELSSIDLTATIVTASAAAAAYADNLIANLSPLISGISPDNIVGTASTAVVVNGQNFQSGSIVKIINTSNTELFTLSTTFNNARSLQFLTPALTASAGPYDIKVTNPDNQFSILENGLSVGQAPNWITASGSLGSIFDKLRSSTSFQLSASDPDNQSVQYFIESGTLPPGMSLSTTGLISGTVSAVSSDTTYSFVIRATDGQNNSNRTFSITIKAPVKQIFSYTGSVATFTVPSGITSIGAKVWGAGGGGGTPQDWGFGSDGGGGGFASGEITVTPGQVLNIVVGSGGVNNSTSRVFGGGGAQSPGPVFALRGGGGGGYSGIFRSTVSQTDALIIAGGGGGGGESRTAGQGVAGGAGGGTVAQDGSSTYDNKTGYRGRGGTTSGPGVEASSDTPNYSVPAIALGGGSPRTNNYGAAGGGGYWGGSAGGYSESNTMAGGGGGSGFIDSSRVSNSQNLTGSNRVPPNVGDTDYPGSSIGYGNIYNGGNGFPGYIVISY